MRQREHSRIGRSLRQRQELLFQLERLLVLAAGGA